MCWFNKLIVNMASKTNHTSYVDTVNIGSVINALSTWTKAHGQSLF